MHVYRKENTKTFVQHFRSWKNSRKLSRNVSFLVVQLKFRGNISSDLSDKGKKTAHKCVVLIARFWL